MCSVFLAVSQTTSIDLEKCRRALAASQSRGPDFISEYYDKKSYFGYNVLSITGYPSHKFNETARYWLGLNGEIYNSAITDNITDTEVLLQKFNTNNIKTALSDIDGMFGLALLDKHSSEVYLARDIQGEKTLYVYYDANWFIVSSTLISIEIFLNGLEIDNCLLHCYFHTRHFLTYNKTIYKNIFQVKPGVCLKYNITKHVFTEFEFGSLYDLLSEEKIKENSLKSEDDLTNELDILLDKNISQMLSNKDCCVSFSGGIDSSLVAIYISKHINNCKLIATNCITKDYISNNLTEFQRFFTQPIYIIDINEAEWCNNLVNTYSILRAPLPSHNYNTKVLFSQYLQNNNIKVCYGGEGADELFGGYNFYKTLQPTLQNVSPYSSYLDLPIVHNWDNKEFKTYIDGVWQKAYGLTKSSLHATSFTDLYLEVVDDGLRNCDQVCGWFGIEGRSLFMRKEIVEFALNLPEKYKRGKPLLHNLFIKHFPGVCIKPKQGFAGFPNETKNYFTKPYDRFSILSTLNIQEYKKTKELTWKLLNTELFYECRNSRYINSPFRT